MSCCHEWTDSAGERHACVRPAGHRRGAHQCGCGARLAVARSVTSVELVAGAHHEAVGEEQQP